MPKPVCKYGARCYRTKNKKHLEEFSHNEHEKKDELAQTSFEKEERKRPLSDSISNESCKHPKTVVSMNSTNEDLKSKFLVSFPPEFFRFWKDICMLSGESSCSNPCTALKDLKSLRLAGVFEYLAGHFTEETANAYLVKGRHANDLPEMQTFAAYDEGRFAYWRDTPDMDKPLVVHVNSESDHFAKLDIVGIADPVYMIAWLKNKYGNKLNKTDHFLSKLVHDDCEALSDTDGKYENGEFNAKYSALLKNLKAKRRKTALGDPFHGLGIVVEVKDDVGYRPLGEKTARLKSLFEEVATASSVESKEKLMEKVMELFCYVQFANDEMDFGMGLEFGHDLFTANYECFDKLAVGVLDTAYQFLERDAFSRILKAHADVRRLSESKNKESAK